MEYKFHFKDSDLFMIYDPIKNTLVDSNNTLININFTNTFMPNNKLQVRLILGMECNGKCTYCGELYKEITHIRKRTNNKKFVQTLLEFIKKYYPETKDISISYWGGEPLLFMDDIKELTEELRSYSDFTFEFSVCTNGKLFVKDIFKYLFDEKFSITISYDGPGQHIRDDYDIFGSDSEVLDNFKKCLLRDVNELSSLYGVNPVFHKANPSSREYIDDLIRKLNIVKFDLQESAYMMVYNDKHANLALTEQEIEKDSFERIGMMSDVDNNQLFKTIYHESMIFLRNLNKPVTVAGCLSLGKKYIGIDMTGNMWGCHGFIEVHTNEHGDELYRGNIFDNNYTPLKLNNYLNNIDNHCKLCVMRSLCGGVCMYSPKKYFKYNCMAKWYRMLPALHYALAIITNGLNLSRIETIEK